MVIKPLDDVMHYFGFAFFAYIVLLIIVSLNFFKALYIRRKNISGGSTLGKFTLAFDLVIDILCGLAMAAGLIFHGVLADNNALGYKTWWNTLLGMTLVSFIIFVLNIIVVLRNRK
jgi:hypothetical protein